MATGTRALERPPTTRRKPTAMTSPETPRLYRDDVARLWSERAGRPISPETVSRNVRHSRPADPETGRPAGRYADDPLRKPRYRGNVPYWTPAEGETLDDLIEDLRAWWDRRPGRIGDPRRDATPREIAGRRRRGHRT